MIRGHAGTGEDQILRHEVRKRIAAKSERAADFVQRQYFVTKLACLAIVNGRDVSAPGRAETRRGHAGAREPHHQHAFAFEFDSWTHHYLNFNVVSENSANTSATIQKRTMIFDSLQPANSK